MLMVPADFCGTNTLLFEQLLFPCPNGFTHDRNDLKIINYDSSVSLGIRDGHLTQMAEAKNTHTQRHKNISLLSKNICTIFITELMSHVSSELN